MCVYCVKCTKFGKLFLRKVIKTVATRCLDFRSKRPKMRLATGLRPDPLGEPLAAKRGPTSKGRGGMEGRGREGRRGEGGRDFAGPIKIWLLRPCTTSLKLIVEDILENRMNRRTYTFYHSKLAYAKRVTRCKSGNYVHPACCLPHSWIFSIINRHVKLITQYWRFIIHFFIMIHFYTKCSTEIPIVRPFKRMKGVKKQYNLCTSSAQRRLEN